MNTPVPALLQQRADSPAIAFVIRGQAYSKANRRKAVTRRWRDDAGQVHTRPQFIKSDEARAWANAAQLQIPSACRRRLSGPVRITATLYYASQRPDLDESLLLDVLQDQYGYEPGEDGKKKRVLVRDGVFRNDRSVWSKRIDKAIDRANPRAEILIELLTAQEIALALGTPEAAP